VTNDGSSLRIRPGPSRERVVVVVVFKIKITRVQSKQTANR